MRTTDLGFVKLNFGKGQYIGQLSIVHVQHQVNLLAFLGNGRLSMIEKKKKRQNQELQFMEGVGNLRQHKDFRYLVCGGRFSRLFKC